MIDLNLLEVGHKLPAIIQDGGNNIINIVSVWIAYFLPTYFTIQFIFVTIYEFYCTFWYYS